MHGTYTRFYLIDLDDIGSIPYSLARPFLLKIESPEKLVSRRVHRIYTYVLLSNSTTETLFYFDFRGLSNYSHRTS